MILYCSFLSVSKEYKDRYAGDVNGELAPKFGYRTTSLRKEYFVYRKTKARLIPKELEPVSEGFAEIGNVALMIMRRLCEEGRVRQMDGDPFAFVEEEELSHSSFWEVFRYNCEGVSISGEIGPRFRVACAEHCDTGILTVIPAPRGASEGLECFDWSENEWRTVEIAEGEAVVFAGELFQFVSGLDVAALCHRVVLPIASKTVRWSLPFELLPVPSEGVAMEVSRLGKGLVSVNY